MTEHTKYINNSHGSCIPGSWTEILLLSSHFTVCIGWHIIFILPLFKPRKYPFFTYYKFYSNLFIPYLWNLKFLYTTYDTDIQCIIICDLQQLWEYLLLQSTFFNKVLYMCIHIVTSEWRKFIENPSITVTYLWKQTVMCRLLTLDNLDKKSNKKRFLLYLIICTYMYLANVVSGNHKFINLIFSWNSS